MKLRALIAAAAASAALLPAPALASSHRDSPFIAGQPRADGTDFYMFRSYEPGRSGFVTLLANYQPFQEPFGGPLYYPMDPNALYEISINNNGNCHEQMTFQFRFTNASRGDSVQAGDKQTAIPLLYTGPITAADQTKLAFKESYTIKLVRGSKRTGVASDVTNADTGATTFTKPLDFVGTKVFGGAQGYAAYANSFISNITIPGCAAAGKVFVGQRADPFVANLGPLFDLVNLNPVGAPDAGTNSLAGKNVTTIAMEIPTACLVPATSSGVVGGWTTASLRQARLVNPTPSFTTPAKEGGAWSQVSRVGNPLVNELLVGVPDKNRFNASKPQNDAQFLSYVTNPAFPVLLNALDGFAVPATPRNDLVVALLTGVPGLNQGGSACEMVRLNTATAATAQGSQNNLGALSCLDAGPVANLGKAGCDPAGYPNGRRPGDDVVDITLRMLEGALLPASAAPDGQKPYTDGAAVSDASFGAAFPYLNAPFPGSPNP